MKKQRVPPIEANLGRTVFPLDRQLPFLPFGTRMEFHGGALAIDHSLQVWDCGSIDGRDYNSCACTAADTSQRDRQVLGDYMIALWTAFRDFQP